MTLFSPFKFSAINAVNTVVWGALFWACSDTAFACSVCGGDPNSPVGRGMAWAVWFLLVTVAFVLACLALFFAHLYKSERAQIKRAQQRETTL